MGCHMSRIKKILATKGISIEYLDLDIDGYYDSDFNTIFINENLSEMEILKVIYHETGHGVLHDEFTPLYKLPIPRFKMEYEADYFMVNLLLLDYMELNLLEPDQVNPVYFIESAELDLKFEATVRKLLYHYIFEAIYA